MTALETIGSDEQSWWSSFKVRNLAITTRLSAAVVGVSVVALLVTTVVGVRTGRSINRDLDRDQLMALRSSAAADVASHMQSLAASTAAVASSPQTATAIDSFVEGHRALLGEGGSAGRDRDALAVEYRTRYVEPLASVRPQLQIRDVLPENDAGVYLQARYSLTEQVAVDLDTIDDAGDGSRWSEAHAMFHPTYRDIVDRLGVLDLLLVGAGSGDVVYSVQKRADLGTSLEAGPFSGSGLAAAVDQARRSSDGSPVITDLGVYVPALATPVGFVASPVFSEERLVGFLVLMYDGAPLDDLLSAGQDWDAGGYPSTGETLLFGGDGKVRTEPRSYVEDASAHLDAAAESGLSDDGRLLVEAADTTVLIQTVAGSTLAAAVSSDTSVVERSNLLGEVVLSTVAPVPLADLDWYVAAEVQVAAAEQSIDAFTQLLIVGVAIIVILVAFLSVAWARRLVRPIRELSDWLGRSEERPIPVAVPARSPVEFHELARSFDSMADRIQSQQQQAAETRRERLTLLHRMLPPAVAARVAAGQLQSVDEVSQASVAVVVVLGLGDLVRGEASDASRDIVNQLLADVDDLAADHQLERIKVVGDAYFASCGHDRPLIDHAPRTLAFAVDAANSIQDSGSRLPGSLNVAVGIHSGPVMVGMTGGVHAVYDVWGETVTTAHLLARQGDRGQILVSGATRARLPDDVELASATEDEGMDVWSVAVDSVRGRS